MILVLDNFDSFTYNLVQLLESCGRQTVVRRNNELTLDDVTALHPEAILLSPGPGRPEGAGIMMKVIEAFASRLPILGVCLGHQAIAQSFGARIVHAPEPMHGKLSPVHHDGSGLFAHMPDPFMAVRYHSLTVDPSSLPAHLEVTAVTPEGVIMGIRHRRYHLHGMQFHPEAVLTERGAMLIQNWLDMQK